MSDHLTITLFDRRPVKILKADWPLVAQTKDWDNQYESQANRTSTLRVRQHSDGRAIIYGIHETAWQGESNRRGGEMVSSGSDIPHIIRRVGERLGFSVEIIDHCIATLPAEEVI